MQKYTSYHIALASFSLLISSVVPVLPAKAMPTTAEIVDTVAQQFSGPNQAQAAQGGPSAFQLSTRDLGCSSQQGYSSAITYSNPNGQNQGYVTDSNAKDPDCLQILMNPGDTTVVGGAMYTADFRLGIKLAESENGCTRDQGSVSWTPWASDGGGIAYAYSAPNIEEADCTWLYYETRNNPNPSVRIENVRVGIGAGLGPIQYTPWASAGGGSSSFSTSSSGGFKTARLSLDSSINYKYNADYTSTTIPQTPASLSPNVPVNANIVMKNIPDVGATTARQWESDQIISSSTNRGTSYCYEWEPTGIGQTCTQTTVYSSTKFKLRRIDSLGSRVQTTSGDLTYRRTVVSQYTSSPVYAENCVVVDDPGLPGGPGLPEDPIILNDSGDSQIKKIAHALFGVKTAQASQLECTVDTGTIIGYSPAFSSQDRSPNVLQNETAQFDLTVTGLVDGSYQLQFQMVKTDTNELFGDPNAVGNSNTIARINVTVGAAYDMSCGANQTVTVGTIAYYTITAVGASSDVSVTMSSNPGGPTLIGSPLILTSKDYTAIAEIDTTPLAPQIYILTFTGDDGVNPPVQCSVNLTVQSIEPTVDIQFNGSDGPVVLSGNQTSGTITWSVSNATSCTASTSPSSNTITPPWTGSVSSVSGSQAVSGIAYNTAYTFTLTCTGPGGSANDSVDVSSVPQNPAGDLYCKQGAASYRQSCSVSYDQNGYLHWDTTFTTSCTISDNNASLPDLGTVPLNQPYGSAMATGNLTQTTTFTLTCQGVGGTTPLVDNLTITVAANPDYSFDVVPFEVTVNQGNIDRTYGVVDNPVEGYNSDTTIGVQSICPSGGGSCVGAGTIPSIVSFIDATQTSPYGTDTTIIINSALLSVGDYIFTFISTSASGVPAQKSDTFTLHVEPPLVLEAPGNVISDNSVCGQITVSWTISSTATPTSFNVYRRLESGSFGSPLTNIAFVSGTTSYSYVNSLATDPTLNTTDLYVYGISAVYGVGQESTITSATNPPRSVNPCTPSLNGSYKKLVGAGNTPPNMSGSWCNGPGGAYTLPNGQVFESGDTVYFEVCASARDSEVDLTNVQVEEPYSGTSNVEKIEFVSSAGGKNPCVEDSQPGLITIGTLAAGELCGFLIKATISNPGGPASSLHYFVDWANITTDQLSLAVHSAATNFVISSDEPTRTETPR